jgi:hypothetical protein
LPLTSAPQARSAVSIDGDAEGLIVLRDDVHHRRAIAEVDEVGIRPRAALPSRFSIAAMRIDRDRRRAGWAGTGPPAPT